MYFHPAAFLHRKKSQPYACTTTNVPAVCTNTSVYLPSYLITQALQQGVGTHVFMMDQSLFLTGFLRLRFENPYKTQTFISTVQFI